MRNDARPIGENLRGIDERAHRERGSETSTRSPQEQSRQTQAPPRGEMKRKNFITGCDPGDEEK
jgi:hypothetical protein